MSRTAITEWRSDEFGVWVTCPGCGSTGRLDHIVESNGEVNPSIDCPDPRCDFHAMVTLDNWTNGRLDATAKTKGSPRQ